MGHEAELRFFRKMMDNLHIQTHCFMPEDPSFSTLELELRAGYEENVRMMFKQAKPNTIYMVTDAFAFSYNYMLLPDSGEMLVIGPYLSQELSDEMLMIMLERYHMPTKFLTAIRRYCVHLPLVANNDLMFTALSTLGETIWGNQNAFEIERMNIDSLLQTEPDDAAAQHALMEAADFRLMEERYKMERQLMHLVSQGHTHRAQMIVAAGNENTMESRVTDPLRNMKNYGIVLNTLLRKAVEEGGVHPLHIDKLSSQMARKLETMRSVDECRQLFSTMIHKYCLLVKNHSMKSYSLLVQHVILRIESDLTADLSLKAHADALSVNASYLSTLFKKETGQTLTDFVSRKRMDHAIFLLNSTDMQVQTIAQYCGIPDVNYFTKTFKRIVGKTPKEYRLEARRADR